MIMNEGATKHKLLTDCEYHDQKNKFIVERMTDARETGFEELRLEVLPAYTISEGLILMKRFLERFRHALFRPFRASSYKNSWQQLSRPSKANASKANLVGSSTS